MTLWDPSTIAVEKSELTLFQSLDGPDAQRCCLVVYSGPDLGRQIVLDEGLATLGRSTVTQLQIGGPGIIRLRAEICVTGSSATLRDLGSAIGGFVGDTRLTDPPQLLKDGDRVRLGSMALKFYAHQSLDAALHDRVLRWATVDAGTGLFNRRYLMDALKRGCRTARQTGRPLCLVMLDLDHFKRVNDRHGHAASDLVLRECAAIASLVVGQAGVLGRIEGEELTGRPQPRQRLRSSGSGQLSPATARPAAGSRRPSWRPAARPGCKYPVFAGCPGCRGCASSAGRSGRPG